MGTRSGRTVWIGPWARRPPAGFPTTTRTHRRSRRPRSASRRSTRPRSPTSRSGDRRTVPRPGSSWPLRPRPARRPAPTRHRANSPIVLQSPVHTRAVPRPDGPVEGETLVVVRILVPHGQILKPPIDRTSVVLEQIGRRFVPGTARLHDLAEKVEPLAVGRSHTPTLEVAWTAANLVSSDDHSSVPW